MQNSVNLLLFTLFASKCLHKCARLEYDKYALCDNPLPIMAATSPCREDSDLFSVYLYLGGIVLEVDLEKGTLIDSHEIPQVFSGPNGDQKISQNCSYNIQAATLFDYKNESRYVVISLDKSRPCQTHLEGNESQTWLHKGIHDRLIKFGDTTTCMGAKCTRGGDGCILYFINKQNVVTSCDLLYEKIIPCTTISNHILPNPGDLQVNLLNDTLTTDMYLGTCQGLVMDKDVNYLWRTVLVYDNTLHFWKNATKVWTKTLIDLLDCPQRIPAISILAAVVSVILVVLSVALTVAVVVNAKLKLKAKERKIINNILNKTSSKSKHKNSSKSSSKRLNATKVELSSKESLKSDKSLKA